MLAPIILFTYNRPKHTAQTIAALKENALAHQSQLYIYQDGLKANTTQESQESHKKTKEYIQNLIAENAQKSLFAQITFIERKDNLGLADSIIDGVSSVINAHGSAIVLEDDIIVSPVFLDYMNAALQTYKDETKVWSISAWGYPIEVNDLGDCYFWRVPHCWGWASWANRWVHYKRDISWVLENFSQNDIDYINIEKSTNFFDHFILNAKGKIKTWAIFNYLISYKHNALTLCPSLSYIKQIGFDGSGVHCNEGGEVFNATHINTKFPVTYPNEIIESPIALHRIKTFERSLKKPLHIRAYNKLHRISSAIIQKVSYLGNGGGVYHNTLVFDTYPPAKRVA